MWQCLTNSKDNVKGSVKYLKEYIGPEFEDIVFNENVYAFNNGIYLENMLIPYGTKFIGSDIVASNYFSIDAPDNINMDFIKNLLIDSII